MKLLFATGNKHKLEEARRALAPYGITVEPCTAPKLELQADSLSSIAAYAAQTAYVTLGGREPVMVEDAGLFIKALNWFPGPYSSYVYKTIGINGVLRLLEGVADREAYFESAVALAHPGGVVVFTHRVYGEITAEPRGSGGFGFDPIFKPRGSERTFAEMSIDEKNKYSHRAGAMRKLAEWIRRRPSSLYTH